MSKPDFVSQKSWDNWQAAGFSVMGSPEFLNFLRECVDSNNSGKGINGVFNSTIFNHTDISLQLENEKDSTLSDLAITQTVMAILALKLSDLVYKEGTPELKAAFDNFIINPGAREAKAFSAAYFSSGKDYYRVYNVLESIKDNKGVWKSLKIFKKHLELLFQERDCAEMQVELASFFPHTLSTLQEYFDGYQKCKESFPSTNISCEKFIEALFSKSLHAKKLDDLEGSNSELGNSFETVFLPLKFRLLALKRLDDEPSGTPLAQKLADWIAIPLPDFPQRVTEFFNSKKSLEDNVLILEEQNWIAEKLQAGKCQMETDCSLSCPALSTQEIRWVNNIKTKNPKSFRENLCDPYKVDGTPMPTIITDLSFKLDAAKALKNKDANFYDAINAYHARLIS